MGDAECEVLRKYLSCDYNEEAASRARAKINSARPNLARLWSLVHAEHDSRKLTCLVEEEVWLERADIHPHAAKEAGSAVGCLYKAMEEIWLGKVGTVDDHD